MKFSSEYNEMIKSNSDFIDSQHDRTECLVELAANLNSQLHVIKIQIVFYNLNVKILINYIKKI